MAKSKTSVPVRKNTDIKPSGTVLKKVEDSRKSSKPVSSPARGFRVPALPALLIILFATILCYLPSLQNQFTDWDDPGYLTMDKDIANLSLKHIFSSYVMGNYHPLTMLSLALEYHSVQLKPWLYHFDNLLLHLITTTLAFFVVKKLSGNTLAATIAAALFGLHPMHVETVAWIADRKDLLYAPFFLGAMLTYHAYLKQEKAKSLWYILTVILFLCSLLSKAVAVTLPIVLLGMDYLKKRRWSMGVILDKLPLLALSLLFGIISIKAQASAEALTSFEQFNFGERVLFASYAFMAYIYKMFMPLNLAAFYPYPKKEAGSLDSIWYLYPILVFAVLGILFYFRKNRVVVFGLGFYIVTIALLLQLLAVGNAIIAERYTYLPYLGLFYIIGCGIAWLAEKPEYKSIRVPVLAAMVIVLALFGLKTKTQAKSWKDSISLWKSTLESQPGAAKAHINLGYEYKKANQYDLAIQEFNLAIQAETGFPEPYTNRGDILREKGDLPHALEDYNRAIEVRPSYSGAYLGRGIVYSIMKEKDKAGADFAKAIELEPDMPEVWNNRGNYNDMFGNYNQAILDYTKAIELRPDFGDAFMNRGNARMHHGDYDNALADLTEALRFLPNDPRIFAARSDCWSKKKEYGKALEDILKAKQLGMPVNETYVEQLKQVNAKKMP